MLILMMSNVQEEKGTRRKRHKAQNMQKVEISLWEIQFAARLLIGELTVHPRDMQLLKDLELENPEVHAAVIEWILRWDVPNVSSEIAHLLMLLREFEHKPHWTTFYSRFEGMPEWFKREYSWMK